MADFLRECPHDGGDYDCQCARCGSSLTWYDCGECGGEGVAGHDCGEDTCCCLDPEDNMVCHVCDGTGGWHACIADADWCDDHPLPGREFVRPGTVEWFLLFEPTAAGGGE